MSVARLFASLQQQETDRLQATLSAISHHIGGSPGLPETIIEAAEAVRTRLNVAVGHRDIPRDADGLSLAYNVVGR